LWRKFLLPANQQCTKELSGIAKLYPAFVRLKLLLNIRSLLTCQSAERSIDYLCIGWLLGRYTKLQQQYNEAFTSIQDQKQLIAQLEEDLRSVNAWSAMFRGTAEVRLTSQCILCIINTSAFHKSERTREFNGSFQSAVNPVSDSLFSTVLVGTVIKVMQVSCE